MHLCVSGEQTFSNCEVRKKFTKIVWLSEPPNHDFIRLSTRGLLTNPVDILVLGLTLLAMEFAIIALWADDSC